MAPATSLEAGLHAIHTWLGSLPVVRIPVKPLSIAPRRRQAPSTVSYAIANDEFTMAFQPIVTLPTGQTFGVEALLRHKFEDPGRAPLRIIRQAEATGTDIELGAWTLAASCEAGVTLQSTFGPDFRMSVNASMAQLEEPHFVQQVQNVLSATGFAANTLEIEITERMLLSQTRIARQNLRGLQELGVSVALDDFGCGMANLQHLCKLKVNRLKTARSILRASSRDWPILQGLVAFAAQLNIPLVAEGIETRNQLDKVLKTGCKEAQGYLFSRPASIEQLVSFADQKREVA